MWLSIYINLPVVNNRKEFLEIVLVVQDKILYKIVKEDSCLTIDREGMRKIGKGGGETWRKEREL